MGALLCPPELLRPRLNRHLGRHVKPLTGERRPPCPSQAPSRPGSRRSGPDAGNPEMLEFALSQETARTAPLLPPEEGREENPTFLFCFCSPLSQRKSNFHFLRALRFIGRQCATPCFLTLTHDPSFQQPRECGSGTQYLPTHLWPVSSGTQEVRRGCLRTCRLLYHPALLPFTASQQVRRLRHWRRLHGVWSRGSRRPVCLAGSRAQIDSATRFSSPGDLPSSTAFSRLRSLLHRTQERWSPTNPGSASLEPGFAQAPVQDADAEVH